MARRRTRNSIGIAGQRGRIDIRGSEYGIHRQPDRLVIHKEPGAEHVTIEGNERHLHFHTGPRPEPGRPFFNFDELGAELNEKIEKRVNREKVVPRANTPKYAPKLPGVAMNLANPMNVIDNTSYWIHPVKLVDAIVSRKRGGLRQFFRDKRAYRRAMRLNERFGPRAAQIIEQFRAEANAAFAELQRLVADGTINRENRNFYFGKYEKAVHEAEVKFQTEKTKLINDYMKEWKGRKAA